MAQEDNNDLMNFQISTEVERNSNTLSKPNNLTLLSKTNNTDNYKFLTSLVELKNISEIEIKELADSSNQITYNQGDLVLIEGEEESTNGFIVISGSFSIFKTSASGKELIVELLQAKDMFGLIILLNKDRLISQLSARALQKTVVLSVPIKRFAQLLLKNPIIYKEFTSHLLLCLHSSYQLSRGLAHDKVEVRIASVLISLALKFSTSHPNVVPMIRFTRQQLADLTGTTPETAIRTTRSMQAEGLIDISRPGIIKITNMEGISELADRHFLR